MNLHPVKAGEGDMGGGCGAAESAAKLGLGGSGTNTRTVAATHRAAEVNQKMQGEIALLLVELHEQPVGPPEKRPVKLPRIIPLNKLTEICVVRSNSAPCGAPGAGEPGQVPALRPEAEPAETPKEAGPEKG